MSTTVERTDYFALKPPYAAALEVSGPPWYSSLMNEGRVVLMRPEIKIGRISANDIVLSDESASRLHAVVRWGPSGYVLQDLGSTNGTYVQGHRVVEPVILLPGQSFRVGGTDFRLVSLQSPQAPVDAGHRTSRPTTVPIVPDVGTRSADGAYPTDRPLLQSVPAPGQGLRGLMKRNARKTYWRVFLILLGAFVLSTMTLNYTQNEKLVPLVLLIGSVVVPIPFVRFLFEEGAVADMPIRAVGITFVSGAVLGLILAALLEPYVVVGSGLGAFLLVGLCEETAKAACVVWFLRDRALRSQLDGIVLGAAAGMGFAALETAGYGFYLFLVGWIDASGTSLAAHLSSGLGQMETELVLRMSLALFGHGVWTAIICAGIWRERGNRVLRLTPGVVLVFAISIVLHGIYDWYASLVDGSLIAVYIGLLVVGLIGMYILRFFIKEAIAREALGDVAPPPPPLAWALASYLIHPFRSQSHLEKAQQSAPLIAALNSAAPVPPQYLPTSPPPWQGGGASAAQQSQPTILCPRCGAASWPNARFCRECGSQMG